MHYAAVIQPVVRKRAGVQLRIAKRNTKKEDAKMEERNDEPRIEVVQPDGAAEELRKENDTLRDEIRRLNKSLAEQAALADAAINLMMVWKEKHELAERTRSIGAELNAKEAAYFDALRAARPAKEANG